MPPSKNPLRYKDVQRIMDAALTNGEALVTFPRPNLALNMRQRIYVFQSLMEAIDPESEYVGFTVQMPSPTELLVLISSLEAFGGTIIDEPAVRRSSSPLPGVDPLTEAMRLLDEGDE